MSPSEADKIKWQQLTPEEREELCTILNAKYKTNTYHQGLLPFIPISKAMNAVLWQKGRPPGVSYSLETKLDWQETEAFYKKIGFDDNAIREIWELLYQTRR